MTYESHIFDDAFKQGVKHEQERILEIIRNRNIQPRGLPDICYTNQLIEDITGNYPLSDLKYE